MQTLFICNDKPALLRRYLLVLVLFLFQSGACAQPVRGRILEDVVISHDGGHHIIEIHLPFRFRYLSHFPAKSGDELRIRLQPVNVSADDAKAVFKRESVVPKYASVVALDEVVYEGDVESGAQLTLFFTRMVSYEVVPDPDYTHIRIVVLSIN